MKKLWLSGIIGLFVLQAQAQLPNPGFELLNSITGKPAFWQSMYILVLPIDTNCTWQGLDSITFATGEAHTGNYALELRTATYCQSETTTGNVKAVLYDVDSFVDQRIPFAKRPARLSFYYKLFSVLADRGYAEVVLEDSASNVVADARINYYQATTWTAASIPLTYYNTDTPAYMTLKFKIKNDWGMHYGTRFLIDDINLEGVTGIDEVANTATLNCYPIPAKNILYIQTGENMNGTAQLSITDATGRTIQNKQMTITPNQELKIEVENLPQGMYFIKLVCGETVAGGKFIK